MRNKVNLTLKTEIRALDVLEYLNHCGGHARVGDIARALDIPQSSASRLLVQLSTAGYLSYDRVARIYRLSARAALLTAKTLTHVFGAGEPMRMMEELRRLSWGTVILTSRSQTYLHVIHIEKQAEAIAPCFRVGEISPLVSSASAKVLLSNFADSVIQALIRRHNAEIDVGRERVRPAAFLDSIGQVRRSGYLIHPVEAALRTIGERCRRAGSNECSTACCLSQRSAHIVAPVRSAGESELAASVGIPIELEARHHAAFAAEAQAIIRRYMPAQA